jgi:hypothetical protein
MVLHFDYPACGYISTVPYLQSNNNNNNNNNKLVTNSKLLLNDIHAMHVREKNNNN